MKQMEYIHSEFQLEGKKFKFETDGQKFTKIEFKLKFPDQFRVLKAKSVGENTIKVNFKGLSGCTLAENLLKSTKSVTKKTKVDLEEDLAINQVLKIEFELTEVENCKRDNFVPETAGGGILVGTGGWFVLAHETISNYNS